MRVEVTAAAATEVAVAVAVTEFLCGRPCSRSVDARAIHDAEQARSAPAPRADATL